MVDLVYKENPKLSESLTSTWLEPACGDGNFLVEILARKLEKCRSKDDVCAALGALFGIDIQADNVQECRSRMLALAEERFGGDKRYAEILERNIVCGNFLTKETTDGNPIWFLEE